MISNKDFTSRDGIFLSYKDTEDNYKKIIQPLDDFFKRYDIKTFCMRESDEVYTAKGGENFVDLECEFICEKTLLFVAFITPEYLDSSECAREIDLMKSVIKKMNGDFDEPKILVLFDDASLDESILKMKRQSWYDSSIIGETNIYYHSSNLDAAKQEILKIFCKKLPKAYEAHQQRKESYYKKEFEKSHLMSDLVLHSLEQTYACTTVSKYILQSHELTDKRSGYEMHIITDEIKNYDMTVLSSMAIALNLQKNVKYIYYGAPETKEYFGKLKEKINFNSKDYIKNTWKKAIDITFSDKDDIVYDKQTNELKATSKEMIKKRFTTFNEEMQINLKIQQHIQIIDKNIEKSMIKNNITFLKNHYVKVLEKYKNVHFTKNIDKIILYKSMAQIEEEINTYFSINMNYQ